MTIFFTAIILLNSTSHSFSLNFVICVDITTFSVNTYYDLFMVFIIIMVASVSPLSSPSKALPIQIFRLAYNLRTNSSSVILSPVFPV